MTRPRLPDPAVIAVLRSRSVADAVAAADALVAGGVTGIEITYSTPGAAEAISRVRERHGMDVVLGAGTVLTAEQAREAADAGAEFLVSPGTREALVAAMRATGLGVMTGAMTPTEVMTAVELGVDIVKLFPASHGGVALLRALRGPFPDVPIMPTGGVTPGNVREWLDAGAIAVGAGSDLVPSGPVDAATITSRAREFSRAARP